MTHDVFISHSNKDKILADAVCAALESRHIRCWIAPRDILPGAEYAEAIINAIENCRVFLLILSTTSNTSPQTTREVERAVSKDITLLPFRIENVTLTKSMEYYLSQCQWLEATTRPIEPYIDQLTETLKHLLDPSAPLPPSAPVSVSTQEPKADAPSPTPAPQAVNPFTFGNPVSEPARFYGRKQEIRQILNRLLSSAHESTSIVGERRIGKTSLLMYLSNPEVAPSLGLTDQYCLVYLDLQGLTDITPQRFWQRVLTKIARVSHDQELASRFALASQQKDFDLFDLEDLFDAIAERDRRVVLFLDEFEYVTQNQNFGHDFFGGLRALAIHHSLSLVPATRRELVELCHSDALKGSPFFNIFANVVLRPFTRQEASELIDGYASGQTWVLTPTEKELVLNLAGGHPLFVQMAGHYVVESKLQALAGEALRQSATTRFTEQAYGHYNFLWSHCSDSEKTTLLCVFALGAQDGTRQAALKLETLARIRPRANQEVLGLIKRGLVDDRDGTLALFSPTFAGWVGKEILATAGEEEKKSQVEAWLSEMGHDKSMPGKLLLPQFKKKYWGLLADVANNLPLDQVKAAIEAISPT